jgi:hypothetical protein
MHIKIIQNLRLGLPYDSKFTSYFDSLKNT